MNNNVIIESFSNRKSVKIKYYSETTDGRTKERVIDVYGYNNRYFGGYCHLRKEMRTFRFDRIVEARPTSEEYTIDLQRLKKLQEAGYITQQDTVKPPLKIKASESLKTKINSNQALKDDLDNTNIIQYEAKGPLANLINYYISCINEEDNKSLKLRIDGSSRNILINFIDKELLISQNKDSIILNNSTRRVIDFFSPSLIDGKEGNVYYGYPIVVNPVGDISPLFYTEINIVKTNDSLKIVRQSQEVYLNQIFFNRDLDLSDEEAKIVIEDIENYFNLHTEFQEKINYIIELLNYDKTFINPELLIPFTKPPDISTSIVNQAIIYTGEVNPITSGLLKELNLLKTKPYYENVEKTCVNFLINSTEQQHSIIKNENSERDIITVLQSNGSQLSVLKSALSNSLTVVTGPPGTGKSQVVVNILANIALKGYSVLFASKNNKAVEVVLEKLSRNLGSDIAVRTGSWEYRKQATEYLKSFNRSGFSYSEFESSRIAVIKAKEQYLQKYNNYKKVQALRNKIEQLQAILDGTFPAQKKEEINILLDKYNNFDFVINLIDIKIRFLTKKYTLFEKLINFFSKSYLIKKINILDSNLKQYLSIDLFEWLFSNDLENKIFYFKIYVATFQELKLKNIEFDSCIEPDILKSEVSKLNDNLLNFSCSYVINKIKYIRSSLSFKDIRMINEYADALDKFSWRSNYKSIKDSLWNKIKLSYQIVLKAFPIWITTNLSADKSIPLLPGMFDYLIIDEASQCDIASALPLMYRAKNLVILGDPFQLKHICTLTRSMDKYLANRENAGNLWLNMSYRDKSLYDLAEYISGLMNRPVYWLLEHYRCHRSIIGFSNDRFYQNKLIFHDKVYDESDGIITGISWADVTFKHGTDKTNIDEIDYIKNCIKKMLENDLFKKLSVGVVTPFRRQTNLLNEYLKEFDVVSGTAHRYQGDERDIMFFSTVINPNTSDRTIGWINNTENLVNVAVSRARRGIVIVGSSSQCLRLDGILKDLARYIEIEKMSKNMNLQDLIKAQSPVERALYYALSIRGIKPILQYPSNGYMIDIALIGATKRIAIEVDGEPYHSSMEQKKYDKERDLVLSKNGWLTMRFTAKDVYYKGEIIANQIADSFLTSVGS